MEGCVLGLESPKGQYMVPWLNCFLVQHEHTFNSAFTLISNLYLLPKLY